MKKTILLSILAMAGALIAGAADYYVSTTGNDANDGLTWATAKASIAGAYALASDSTADTIHVADGTYTIASALAIEKPCLVTSVNGAEHVTLECAGNFIPLSVNHASARFRGFTLLSDNKARAYNAVKVSLGTIDSLVITNFATSKYTLVFQDNSGSFHMATNCILTGCRLTGGGRMIDSNLNGTTITHCRFVNNKLENGYLLYTGGNTVVRNCLVYGNVNSAAGAPFLVNLYNGVFENCTFASNRCTKANQAAYYAVNIISARGTWRNCIFWGNTDPNGNICDWSGAASKPTYCCSSTAGLTGTGCTTGDPNFKNPGIGDFHIGSGSCVDAGTNQGWMNAGTDLDGNARIVNEKVDIGCYEYRPGALECSALIDSSTFVGAAEVTMTASVAGADLSGLTYSWALTNETTGAVFTYSGAAVSSSFAYGEYSVGLTVESAGGETATFSATPFFSVKPPLVFAAMDGTQRWPYDTAASAFTNLADAVAFAADGMTIRVMAGTYTNLANPVLNCAVTMESVDGAAATTVHSPVVSSAAWTISHAQAVLRGFTFLGQYATTRSTAVVAASAGTLADCVATNFTTSGTIFNASGACLFSNCVVSGCQTTGGWLVGLNFSGSMAANCRFTGNTLASTLTYLSSATLRNCLLADNVTAAGQPFLVNNYNGSGTIENCTIANNRTTSTDTGAYAVIASGTIRNTILWNNTLPGGVVRDWSGTASALTRCCSSTEGMTGTGCTTEDPCFSNAAKGRYWLKALSPCIDSGANQGWMTSATDLLGNPRIRRNSRGNGVVDMGCYEFSQSSFTLLSIK